MVVITGASSGIGHFLLSHFEKQGKVCGTFNTASNSDPRLTRVDVRNYEEVEAWRSTLPLDKSNKVTLINCAGVSYNSFAHKADISSWQNVINTNLIGTFNVIRSFLPLMREACYGRIINLGSVVAQKGVMGTSAYASSKSALWGLAKSLAVENAGKGITVNNINLGYSDIGMGLTQISEPQRADLITKIPAQRFGSADEIAKTIEYFVATEYANGTSIDLNGGLF